MDTNKRLKLNNILPGLIILIGILLGAYMISVEEELGAVPLLLISSGIGWWLITRYRSRR